MGWFTKEKQKEEPKPELKPKKVKVLGVRMAEETRGMTTYNTTWYCLLVEYEDGSRAIYECGSDDPDFEFLMYYIPMD